MSERIAPGSPGSVADAAAGAVRDWMAARGAPARAIEDLAGRVHMVVEAGVRRTEADMMDLYDAEILAPDARASLPPDVTPITRNEGR